ncbi:MAG: serine hydrolase domain-containing protein [Planctomycetota bacterium]|jgi:CubicO group peptidase (beta-lactamase class C family)
MLGTAIAEGKIGSVDDRLIDYFPEFMDVPEGRGPKPGRYAKPEDAAITLCQLISNTSGYMKPGETPGAQFHYQSFGMNVLSHGIAAAYGLYDASDPDRLPGIAKLIEEKISRPIGGSWTYGTFDFEHPPGALTNIFGHSFRMSATPRDMARMGLLWLHMGRWEDRQVVPEAWMRQATQSAPDIRENCPHEQWRYGYGFWTNDHGLLFPSLPRDAFAAVGAGRNHIWVSPGLHLVVAQNPGIYQGHWDDVNSALLTRITEACR